VAVKDGANVQKRDRDLVGEHDLRRLVAGDDATE
jgi:hypothetical protein